MPICWAGGWFLDGIFYGHLDRSYNHASEIYAVQTPMLNQFSSRHHFKRTGVLQSLLLFVGINILPVCVKLTHVWKCIQIMVDQRESHQNTVYKYYTTPSLDSNKFISSQMAYI